TNALPGGIHVNHYFTGSQYWYIRTNAPRGLIHYDRTPIRFTQDNDFNTGKKPHRAMQTLYAGGLGTSGILTQVTANQNDVVYMMAESNTAAATTDYQSNTTTAALDWS